MKRLRKSALFLFTAMLIAGQLYAQPVEPTAPAGPAGPAGPAAKNSPVLKPEEMRKQATELRAKVRLHLQHVQHLQTKVRNAKDVIKLTCVNDKFVKLKAEANIFDMSHRELIAVLDSDSNERVAVHGRLTRAASEVHKVREEADGCVGETDLGAGSENDFTSPDLFDDPTLGLPFDIEVEPPAYASPYI